MALDVVNIGSQDYIVYGSLSRAEEYLSAAFHADSWSDSTVTPDEKKSQLLVTVTRLLNRQTWRGDKVSPTQELAFPRVNMGTIPDAQPVDSNGIPIDIVNASFELATALNEGSDVQNQQTTVERVRSISAGSVSISNFRGIDSFPTRFPQIIQELLRMYLAGSGSTAFAGTATGTDGETVFPANLGVTGGL